MRKIFTLFALFILCLTVTACESQVENGAKEPVENNDVKVAEEVKPEENPGEPEKVAENQGKEEKEKSAPEKEKNAPQEEEKEYTVSLFFPTENYIVNGDESVKSESIETSLKGTLSEIPEEVVEKLSEGPGREDLDSVVKKEQFNSLTVKDGIVIADVKEGILTGGSLDEELFINQLVPSLMSIHGIKGVQILVNGKVAETLSGHYAIDHVLTGGV